MPAANNSVIHCIYSDQVGDKHTKSPVEFTKFEEKKRQQTEKRTKLLKFSVFRKSSSLKGVWFIMFPPPPSLYHL
jgi:hypothetical protein